MINISNIFPDSTAEILEKGKVAAIGEIRTWNGKKYQKTANGWVPAKSENPKQSEEQKDESSSSKRSEELLEKLHSSGLTKEELLEYKELASLKDTQSQKKLSNKSTWSQVDEYAKNSLDAEQLRAFKTATFDRYTSSGRGDKGVAIETLRKMTEEGKDAQTAFKEAFDAKVNGDSKGSLEKPITNQQNEQQIFPVDTNEQNTEEQGSQEKQYTPEQLDTYAKAASDKALKAASVSGNETLRIAAKKELNRRKQEGMEVAQPNENPFENMTSQK